MISKLSTQFNSKVGSHRIDKKLSLSVPAIKRIYNHHGNYCRITEFLDNGLPCIT